MKGLEEIAMQSGAHMSDSVRRSQLYLQIPAAMTLPLMRIGRHEAISTAGGCAANHKRSYLPRL